MPKTNIFPLFFSHAENVEFNTTEKCGGQILVNYREKWEHVCLVNLQAQELLCQKLGCGGHDRSFTKPSNSKWVNLWCTPLSSILKTFHSLSSFVTLKMSLCLKFKDPGGHNIHLHQRSQGLKVLC